MPAPAAPSGFAIANSAMFLSSAAKAGLNVALGLAWTDNAGDAQHEIEYGLGASPTSYTRGGIADVVAEAWRIDGLKPATLYTLRVRARNGDGASAWVTIQHTTAAVATAEDPPLAPASLSIGTIYSYGAELSWTDNSTNETWWVIEVFEGSKISPAINILHAQSLAQPGQDGATLSHLVTSLKPSTAYRVRVRAFAAMTASATTGSFSAYSNEVFFETAAPTIEITSPLLPAGEVGVDFSYQVTTNTPATSFSVTDGALPDGLSLNGATGLVTGSPTTVGQTACEITAGDGVTSDARSFTFTIRQASLEITSAAAVTATVGVAFSHTITTRSLFGASAANAWGVANKPSWMTRTGAILSGTPTSDGIVEVQLSAGNGATTVYQALRITIAPMQFTSAATATAVAGQQFSLALAASVAGASFAADADALPGWLELDSGTISGTPPQDAGGTSIEIPLVATLGEWVAAQVLVVSITELFIGPSEITVRKGTSFEARLKWNGAGNVEQSGGYYLWRLTGKPAGVEIDAYGNASGNVTYLKGTPTLPGEYQMEALAQVGGVIYAHPVTLAVVAVPEVSDLYYSEYYNNRTFTVPIDRGVSIQFTASYDPASFAISGLPDGMTFDAETGLLSGFAMATGHYAFTVTATNEHGTSEPKMFFLLITAVENPVDRAGWLAYLHSDPTLVDLQIAARGRKQVRSYYMQPDNSIHVQSGDDLRVGVVLTDRDQFLADAQELVLTIAAADEYDSPIFEISNVEVIEGDGGSYYVLEVPLRAAELAARFRALNAPAGPNPAARSLACMASLLWVRNGVTSRSAVFGLVIEQNLTAEPPDEH